MKKLILVLSISLFTATMCLSAEENPKETTQKVDSIAQASDSVAVDTMAQKTQKEAAPVLAEDEPAQKETGIIQVIKEKMIEGGVEFMGIVLLCLIIGLTIAVERVITLNLATSNTKKLLATVKSKLFGEGIQSARDSMSEERGPIAGIFAQGLFRLKNGEPTGEIESSVVNHGSAEMAKLEKGLSWINLFISLAPMFGFMGTVIGMIQAFDKIANTGEMEIGSVAGGIKVALLTTVAGLIVAIILQVFYNYCVAKIEDLSANMEESTNSFMDMVSKYKRENA